MVPPGGVGRLVPVSTFCGRVRSDADFVFGAFLLLGVDVVWTVRTEVWFIEGACTTVGNW